jgi:general nucleoside transport system ATP-binding protein
MLVTLTGITKRFGTFAANDGVFLNIAPGQAHALLGENGAGKSTLVKMLFGLLQPDAGVICWKGEPVHITSPDAVRKMGIAMVFQHFSLFEDMTVLENIALGLPDCTADSALAERATAFAARYGLSIQLDAPIWSLSAGERQRIEIVRCLLQKPKLLVLDEPTSVLTPHEAEALFQTLELLIADGASVLFISHKLLEVKRFCTAATILRGGKLVATVDPRMQTTGALASMMVGVELDALKPRTSTPTQAMLTIEDVSVTPQAVHGVALKALNLTVGAGEIVAIAGVAGAGQNELFAVLSGEEGHITAGKISMSGADVTAKTLMQRRDLGGAFVPEDRLGHATLPTARLSENLVLSLPRAERANGAGIIKRRSLLAILKGLIVRFDIRASSVDPEAWRLSGGNLQKYVIGREIARNPKLLVVNQPTWGVDALAAQRIRQALMDLAAAGTAVLVISQDLDEVFAISDRIAVIHDGKLSQAQATSTCSRESIGLLMTTGDMELRHAA